MHTCQILIIILYLVSTTNGTVFRFEADSMRNKENHEVLDLSNASGGKAVLLKNGEHLSLIFCLRTASIVQIADLRFSNGNGMDTVRIKIDGETVGIFTSNKSTQSDINTFMSIGPFPTASYLDIGSHTLQVRFNATEDGFAIDYIEIDVDDKYMTQEIVMCEVTCIPDFNFNWQHTMISEGLSYARQNSYNNTCSEISNVNIPLFDKSVKTYEITAAMPQYRSLSNPKDQNASECYHLSKFFWTIRDIKLSNGMSGSIRSDRATVYLSGGLPSSTVLSTKLNLTFNVEGKSKGMTDVDRGAILRIQFSGMTGQTVVQMQYKGRAAISSKEQKTLTPSESEVSWSIPDFTWTETDLNLIYLYIDSSSSLPLSIDTLSLARRPLLPDQVVGVYKDDDVIVEAVVADLWWLAPDSMRLTLSNGHSYNNVSYFRIYEPVLWNSGYAQVFVMYHDGYTRLLPLPPDGVDWIPFGSSVVVGQANPADVRPYAAITSVYLDVEFLTMDVKYKDGGSAKLQLQTSLIESRVIVSDIVYGVNSNYPFATFRSMFVAEGNCDADQVSVNGAPPRHIMENFGSIMGRSFVFYRKCMSKHLNLSPDIYINIDSSM